MHLAKHLLRNLSLAGLLLGALPAQELKNGGFEAGMLPWSLSTSPANGYEATSFTFAANVYEGASAAAVDVTAVGAQQSAWRIRLQQGGMSMDAGIHYTVRSAVRGSVAGLPFLMLLQKNSSPWTIYAYTSAVTTTDWSTVEFDHTPAADLQGDARVVFWLGQSTGTYSFDAVSLSAPTSTPNAVTDWSVAGVPGGIPQRAISTTVLDFGAVGDGTVDDSAAIQEALDGAADDTAVLLPAGTYLLTQQLWIPDNVTLRGVGGGQSKLRFDLGGQALTPLPVTRFDRGNWVGMTTFATGAWEVDVVDATQVAVGEHVQIVQDNDAAVMYTQPEFDQPWAADSVGEVARVVAIDGDTLTLDRPLAHDYRVDLSPRLRRFRAIEGVGIEDLRIERVDAGDATTVLFKHAANCWIKNVESAYTSVAHCWISICANIEVRHSWFHGSFNYGGGGHGYGVVAGENSVGCLIEDNVFDTLRHAMMAKEGAATNVFGYNFSTNPVWTAAGTPTDLLLHGHFPAHNLFEGNVAQQCESGDYWGPSGPGNTFARNRVAANGLQLLDHSHEHDVVGNRITGGLLVEGGVHGTWLDENTVDGVTAPPLASGVPNSYYHSSVPPFWGSQPFPAFGPGTTVGNRIPAEDRFLAGSPVAAVEAEEPARGDVFRKSAPVGVACAATSRRQVEAALASTVVLFGAGWNDELRQLRQKMRHARKQVAERDGAVYYDRYEERLLAMDEFARRREVRRGKLLKDARAAYTEWKAMSELAPVVAPRAIKAVKRR